MSLFHTGQRAREGKVRSKGTHASRQPCVLKGGGLWLVQHTQLLPSPVRFACWEMRGGLKLWSLGWQESQFGKYAFAPIHTHTHSVLLNDMPMNFHMAAANACTETEVSWLEDTEGSDLRTRKRKSSTYRQGGMWWGRFLWACTAWGGSRWRRILQQLLTGQLSAGRARTAWLSVSPNGQKEREIRLDNALQSARFDAM